MTCCWKALSEASAVEVGSVEAGTPGLCNRVEEAVVGSLSLWFF